MAQGTTVLDLRRRNRARVLREVLLVGESTRATLANTTDLSTATVTNVVSSLMAEGLIQEAGTFPSNGGRPISRLVPRPETAYVIGADIGEHGMAVELFDLALRQVDRIFDDVPSMVATPQTIATTLRDTVSTIRERNPSVEGRLIGLGLGLPGIVDTSPDGERILHAQTLGWDPVDLRELFHDPGLPLLADNGARTMAMAEMWRGGARQVDHCIVALIGRGVGAGFIVEGKLIRGRSNSAGEWGHTKVSLEGLECACGGKGCLEAYVGGRGIMERWLDSGGTPEGTEEQAVQQLITRAGAGDEVAIAVLDETVDILGTGLANLVNLFNPEKVIIGGWAGHALSSVRLGDIAERVVEQSLIRPAQHVCIEVSSLGNDAVALGAALLPLQELVDGSIPSPGLPA